MAKRNKKRYVVKPIERKSLAISGNVFLQYADEEAIEQAAKGDLLCYPYNESLNSTRRGEYDTTGFSGYFKVDIHDGKQWCLVLVNDIFTEREHHFSKSECPIDTYRLCAEKLRGMAGKLLHRTYREHYTLFEDPTS